MQGGGAYVDSGGSADFINCALYGPSGRQPLQTTRVDDLYTLTVGSGSNAPGPGVIEDAALAQRGGSPRQHGASGLLPSLRRLTSASSEASYGCTVDPGSARRLSSKASRIFSRRTSFTSSFELSSPSPQSPNYKPSPDI